MPNWKTHIEIGNTLRNYLKFNDEEFELFSIGNIAPDINNSFMIKDISKKINHAVTHFSDNGKTYEIFYNKYKQYMNNPFILGYYIHLFTDYTWNNNYYERLKKEGIDISKDCDNLRIIKQHDFRMYNNKFIDNTIQLNNIENIVENSKIIEEISLTKEDIQKTKRFLDEKIKEEGIFEFYKMEELDNLFKQTTEIIKSQNYVDKSK